MNETSPERPVVSLVLGTAGHIDHGKSSLVEQLTGTHPSRLKEEQERGMTIDVGYAEFQVNDGLTAGIIDVPGHERFIRNMVAGASGMDFVILVIAADDGVMTQTKEHLQILELLGIDRGMTVLTKIDAVDEELLELVQEDVQDYLKGTFLADAPFVKVSNTTGIGIDDVKATLRSCLVDLPARHVEGVFRMPIQRSFSIKGHGTVVTGVPISGSIEIGTELEVLPGGLKTRVRGIQVHHIPADSAHAGHRTAINVVDIKAKEISRGDVVASRDYFSSTKLIEARLKYLDHFEVPMRNRMPIRLHCGTVDVGGEVVLLDREVLLPGDAGLVQLLLDEEVVIAAGDPFVLRLASPVVTLGGGKILGETKWKFKRFKDWLTENIENKENHLEDKLGYLEYVIRSAGRKSSRIDELCRAVKLSADELKMKIGDLMATGRVVELEKSKAWVHQDLFKDLIKYIDKGLLAMHEAEGLVAGFQNNQIVKHLKLELTVVEKVVSELVQRGKLEVLGGGQFRHKKFTGGLTKEDMRLVKEIEVMHSTELFLVPVRSVVASQLGKTEKKIKELMIWLHQMGILVPVSNELSLHADAIKKAEEVLIRHLKEVGVITALDFKDLIGASRKYAIPILEYFDKKGLTKRNDNERSLVDGWEKRVADSTLAALLAD